jgi:hypothetical protein
MACWQVCLYLAVCLEILIEVAVVLRPLTFNPTEIQTNFKGASLESRQSYLFMLMEFLCFSKISASPGLVHLNVTSANSQILTCLAFLNIFFWHSTAYNLDTKINCKHYVNNTYICTGTAIPSHCRRLIFGIFNNCFS